MYNPGVLNGLSKCGCLTLKQYVDRINPLIHVFGHIHSGSGEFYNGSTNFVNASIVNDSHKIVNEPKVLWI